MKKIIQSLFIIFAVAATAIGWTAAFYNDTEMTTANSFTTGSLDLLVDSEAHYNGLDCEAGVWVCEPWADSAVLVQTLQGLKKNGQPVNANRSIPAAVFGAPESSGTDYDNPVAEGTFYSLGFGGRAVFRFENLIANGPGSDIKIFEITGGTTYPDETAIIEVSQDGSAYFLLGTSTRDEEFDIAPLAWARYVRVTDTSKKSLFEDIADGFDLDAIEALHCDSPSIGIVGEACEGTWEQTDLEDGVHKFFYLTDIKPGDLGENTISLHVEDDDAWARIVIDNIMNSDNGCVEPEIGPDSDCVSAGDPGAEGELQENLDFFVWLDQGSMTGFQNGNKEPFDLGYDFEEGDNVWQAGFEPILIEPGTIDQDGEIWNIFDGLMQVYIDAPCIAFPTNGQNGYGLCQGIAADGRLVGSTTYYFGVGWGLSDSAGNEIQSDLFGADLSIQIEQWHNNGMPFLP